MKDDGEESYSQYQERLVRRYFAISGKKLDLYDPVVEMLQISYLCVDDIARRAAQLQKGENAAVKDAVEKASKTWLCIGLAGGAAVSAVTAFLYRVLF